jgi:hypothetical protein
MKPSFLNLFLKKFTRERVVPIISARVSRPHVWDYFLGPVFFAEAGEQQKSARQPFFARIEKLIDQIRLSNLVTLHQVRDKEVRKLMFFVKRG